MVFVQHGSNELVYGVLWKALEGVGSAEEQAQRVARKNGYSSHCVVLPRHKGGESLVGGIKKRVGRKSVIPAAVAFAQSVESGFAVYVGLLPSAQYVLVGLLDGIPSPSFDVDRK